MLCTEVEIKHADWVKTLDMLKQQTLMNKNKRKKMLQHTKKQNQQLSLSVLAHDSHKIVKKFSSVLTAVILCRFFIISEHAICTLFINV